MPLVPPVTPLEVEQIGALFPNLFNFPDQTTLDTFVQGAIDYADGWMIGHMGPNYGLSLPWQVELQRRGQMYLALEAICDTIKAEKIYGTHFAYLSEESPSYAELITNEWGVRAMASLDLWVTVEDVAGGAFALPVFMTSSPLIENEIQNPALAPLSVLYSELLDRARGIANPDIGTIRR